MVRWNVVTRDDLRRWADADGAPGQLPELVRRLIHETARDSVEALDFPGGSGVTSGGFDGFARSSSATPFIPAGPSVWELSVRKDAAKKADEDITKRDAVPDGSAVDQTTYVQVIARAWTKASDWGRDWTAKSSWKRVEGYNVDRLAMWVEQAPATRIWLLERLDKPVTGVVSGTEWWDRWSDATEPVLTPEVVLSRGIGDLRPALGRTGMTTVGGAVGVNEIVACVVAAAVEGDRVERVVVVDDRSAWQRLLKEVSPLVLIATDAGFGDDVGPDVQQTVVLPVPQSDDADVVLERADSERVAEALRSLTDKPSHDLGALARRSFVTFRRRIARRPELMTPPWAVGAIPRPLRTALLLVEWSDACQADRDVVAALAGMPYDAVREELLRYTAGDDPLLALTTDRWLLVSPADAWQQLGRHLLTDDLQAFVEQASVVLGERDPALDLRRAERWRAGIDGKVLQNSHALRKGVATGLALLGTYGDRVVAATGVHGEHWAGRVLRPLLEICNADRTGDRWASLAELLPLLVEAMPGEVLEAFRLGASGDDPVLATIFQDDSDESSLFGPASPHTHFLWALETAAWSTDHVGAAVDLLAALTTLDPGGRLSNRPAASLANIFCSWHPDTAADVDQRLAIIDRLRKRWPTVADQLLVGLLPEGMQGIHFPTSEPSFRDWKPAPYVVLRVDHWRVVEGALERLLEDAAADGDRWTKLLKAHQHLPADLRARIRDAARTLDVGQLTADSRRRLWEDLRKIVAHHREYADAKWALPDEELRALDELATTFEPGSPEDRHRWLFLNQWIELGDVARRDDYDAYDQEVANRRAGAMNEILLAGGLEAVANFAATADAAVVGAALAQASPDDETTLTLLEWYESGSETKRIVAASYLRRRGSAGGLEWVRQLFTAHPELPPATQAEILHDANSVPEEWDEARSLGENVEREYWLRYGYTGRGHDFAHVLTAADRMIAVGRWAAALHMLSMYQRKSNVDASYAATVARALEGLLTSPDPEVRVLDTWDYERAFAVLDAHVDTLGLSRVTQLQWGFFPALGYDPPTTTLHRALANDPAFFVEILSLVYRAKGDDGSAVNPQTEPAVSENAWRLLQSWHVAPGQMDDGAFDVARASTWIDEARRLLVEADRLDVGLEQIGEVLIHTPTPDEGWPSAEVAELIEGLEEDEMDHGIRIGLSNARGGTSRSLTEGGEQERTLAVEFRKRATRFRDSHPRVARILNAMAESYEADARREDREAERRRRGLDR